MDLLDLFGNNNGNLPLSLSPYDVNGLGNARMLGLAQGLLQASGPSRLPIGFGQAFGQGLAGMQQAGKDYTSQAVDAAKIPYITAQTAESQAKSQLTQAQAQQLQRQMQFLSQAGDAARALFSQQTQPPVSAPQGQSSPNAAILGSSGVTGDDFIDRTASSASAGPLMAHLTQNLGYTPGQAAAVLGNAQLESGLKTSNPGDGGTSDGLFQWHNDRLDNLKSYASSVGKPWTDPITQLNFMDRELRTTAPEFFQTQNPMQAAQLFQDRFERPARDTGAARGRAAMGILANYGGQAGGALPGVPDFTGRMDGSEGAPYAPQGPARPVQVAQNGPLTSLPGNMPARVTLDRNGPGGQLIDQDTGRPLDAAAPQPTAAPQGTGNGQPFAPPQSTMDRARQVFTQQLAQPLPGTAQPRLPMDPRAVANLGFYAAMGGLPDIAKPFETYLYSSPEMKGAQAGAESGARAAGELPFVGPKKAAEQAETIQHTRDGFILRGGQIIGVTPRPMETVDPVTGQKSHVWVMPPMPGQPGPQASAQPSPTGQQQAANTAIPGTSLVSGLGPGQTKSLDVRAEEEQKQRQKVIDEGAAAQTSQATLQNMANETGNFTQGPFADHAQVAARYLRLIDPRFDGQVSSYENFVKNAGALTRQAVKEVSGRAAVQEFNMIQSTLPNPEMSPIGLRKVQGEIMGLNDFRQAKTQAQQAWEEAHGGIGNVSGFETDFQKQVSPYAFIVARMDPADRKEMLAKLQSSEAGRTQLGKIQQQLQFIKSSGLDQAIQ